MAKCTKTAMTEKDARTMLNSLKKHPKHRGHRFKKDKIPVRCYKCPECGQWHLTSESRKHSI